MSLALDEPLLGTASVVRSWILLEHPGPWGYEAIIQNRLPRRVARALRDRGRDLRIRVVLIRRPGRSEPAGRECYFAHTGLQSSWLQHTHLPGGATDLLDLDWEPLANGHRLDAVRTAEDPIYLVCTNGARDPCCAERGRPLARALAAAFGERLWESSHIGGDRFAGNLVCFPHGLYFGRVSPDEAVRIAMGYEEGRLDLEHYRGRSCYDFATQAAECLLRRRDDLRGVDDLFLTGRQLGQGRVRAEFTGPGGEPLSIELDVERAVKGRSLTCHGTDLAHPPRYVVRGEASARG